MQCHSNGTVQIQKFGQKNHHPLFGFAMIDYHKIWQKSISRGEAMGLNKILRGKGISAKEISEQTGLKYGTVLKYSSGELQVSVKSAKKIAPVLGMNWWELMEDLAPMEGDEQP